jgi:hypothetical protein
MFFYRRGAEGAKYFKYCIDLQRERLLGLGGMIIMQSGDGYYAQAGGYYTQGGWLLCIGGIAIIHTRQRYYAQTDRNYTQGG